MLNLGVGKRNIDIALLKWVITGGCIGSVGSAPNPALAGCGHAAFPRRPLAHLPVGNSEEEDDHSGPYIS